MFLWRHRMRTCAECGKEIDELDEKAIIDMPFAGELVSFCCEKCKNGSEI